MSRPMPSILSIQSHVVHGYVGNKAATFPLLLHGFDVDALNTVSLSNHSAYPVIRGHRMDLHEYELVLDGLRAHRFLQDYDYVLTGYINNADVIRRIEATVQEIRTLQRTLATTNGNGNDNGNDNDSGNNNDNDAAPRKCVRFFCDPVMGDNGVMYCKDEVVDAYRDLVHAADVVTPNYYEASLLSGVPVCDLASAKRAADWFHARGVATVVIKSFAVPGDATRLQFLLSCAAPQHADDDNADSGNNNNNDDEQASTTTTTDAAATRATRDRRMRVTQRYTGFVPYHEGVYTGTGDSFAASFVAFCHKLPMPVALGKAMGVLQDLILATREQGGVGAASLKSRELRVSQYPARLLEPLTHVDVVALDDDDANKSADDKA